MQMREGSQSREGGTRRAGDRPSPTQHLPEPSRPVTAGLSLWHFHTSSDLPTSTSRLRHRRIYGPVISSPTLLSMETNSPPVLLLSSSLMLDIIASITTTPGAPMKSRLPKYTLHPGQTPAGGLSSSREEEGRVPHPSCLFSQ